MVKFSRELEAQLIPEWKDAFVDYRRLKKHVKKIKLTLLRPTLPSSSSPAASDARHSSGGGDDDNVNFNSAASSSFSPSDHVPSVVARFAAACSSFSPSDRIASVVARFAAAFRGDRSPPADAEENLFEMDLIRSRELEEEEFMEKLLEEELQKVNSFYTAKEEEFCERGEILSKQLRILLDLKQLLHDHRHQHSTSPTSPGRGCGSAGISTSLLSNPSAFSEPERGGDEGETGAAKREEEEEAEAAMREEVIAALERNGVSFVASGKAATVKKSSGCSGGGGKLRAAPSLRIDIPLTTPARAISMIWEDLVSSRSSRKEGSGGDYISSKKVDRAEKMIREAFVQLYRALGLLRTYSSLNMEAFRKILKKFEKVSSRRQESAAFARKVRRSHFVSSDKVTKAGDEMESIFISHFAANDRKKAMKFLRPQQPRESHTLTFFVGLFTGSFVTLFAAYAILAHLCGIFSDSAAAADRAAGYMETVYPIFSMFALISLHIFLHGCNIFAWRSTRINHNFIFEFSPTTALKHRDAFLISSSLMTAVVSALVAHLLLRSAGLSRPRVDAIPGAILLLFTGILICPFNVFYRSARFSFMQTLRNIVFAPLYRVLMVDFYLADQLTSQIPLLRHMELTACCFAAAGFRVHPYETCTQNHQYKMLAYIISFLPYYWRALQCLRRYAEEGYDVSHLANAGKYVSAMVAAAARFKYALEPTPLWLATVVLTSTGATLYQLFWDFVKDWGLFDFGSQNLMLRDELVLKNKSTYYFSIALNFLLRLAWIESIMRLSLGKVEHRMVDFLLASLEIIRRGHWNFYRLENEHLNNVGKFRAVKTVPLPFSE